ncbi:MAG: hypothetical protein PUG67_05950, partial [Peptoniphilaceae bacterium]|nr:hypothetical protein [Peptoniphilaceae bacterium]
LLKIEKRENFLKNKNITQIRIKILSTLMAVFQALRVLFSFLTVKFRIVTPFFFFCKCFLKIFSKNILYFDEKNNNLICFLHKLYDNIKKELIVIIS